MGKNRNKIGIKIEIKSGIQMGLEREIGSGIETGIKMEIEIIII